MPKRILNFLEKEINLHKKLVIYLLVQTLVIIAYIGYLNNEAVHSKIGIDVNGIGESISEIGKDIKILAVNDSIMFTQLRHFPTSPPITVEQMTKVSSMYSTRINPITDKKEFHCGIDYRAKRGTPVYAAASGIVEIAQPRGGYGKYVCINHNNGYQTTYSHLENIEVIPNQIVEKGQEIGKVGITGMSTGYHLHFEIIYQDVKINPNIFIDAYSL